MDLSKVNFDNEVLQYLSVRKDELIVPEESDDDDEIEEKINKCPQSCLDKKNKPIRSIEETHQLTEQIESKMEKVQTTLKHMDRLMNNNLKVIIKLIKKEEKDQPQNEEQEVNS